MFYNTNGLFVFKLSFFTPSANICLVGRGYLH